LAQHRLRYKTGLDVKTAQSMLDLKVFASSVFALGLVHLGAGLSTRNCLVTGGRCESTECLGSDWGCYNQTNTQVGGAGQVYRIRNARSPRDYLELRTPFDYTQSNGPYLPPSTNVGRAAAAKTYQWTLMKLPSKSSSPFYLMFTEKMRDYAMTYGQACYTGRDENGTQLEVSDLAADTDTGAKNKTAVAGNSFSISAACNYMAKAGKGTLIQGIFTSFTDVAMKLTMAPVSSGKAEAPLVMISSAARPNEFLTVSDGDFGGNRGEVIASFNDPGASGYWFFDPPLPSAEIDALPAYSGPRCSQKCGRVGNIKDVGQVYINAVAPPPSLGWMVLLSVAASASAEAIFGHA